MNILFYAKFKTTYFLQLVTLIGMWIIPLGMCVRNLWWRFVFFWLVFSCITGLIVRKTVQRPMLGTTPRFVIFQNVISSRIL